MKFRGLGSLLRNKLGSTRTLSIASALIVLLFITTLNTAPSSVMAQVPIQRPSSNSCEALAQRDFTAIPDAPTALFSAQVVPAAVGTPEYCDVKGYVTPQVQFELRLPTQN